VSLAVEVVGLSKAYIRHGQEHLALDGVDLQVAHGEFVCLLGPSGCGKTTLLNILAGLDRADAGSVTVRGPHGGASVMGYVFQQSRLLPWLSVRGNLRFVLDGAGRVALDEADYWLDRVGLAGRGSDFPNQLSVGQQQRVAVARALIIRPDVLYMDEPFSSLDELTASKMREELLGLWSELGCTVVFVTHNPLEATFLADRIVIMSAGPGRIDREQRVSDLVPRPRDADDPRLWEASRIAVRALRDNTGADAAAASRSKVPA
jgi:ABC-type nitrate/sulfonate/bicarbonate transport system ATPase subunit